MRSLPLMAVSLTIASFLLSTRAHANAFFIEPYAGIGQVQIAVYDSTKNDYDSKDIAAGYMLGMKAGYAFSKIFAGLDYQTGGPYVFGRAGLNAEWTTRMIGGGVGLDYDIARFWAGYYFDDQIDDTKNQWRYKGAALKVGFGLKVSAQVHANIDVVLHDLRSAQSLSGSPVVSNPGSSANQIDANHRPQVTTIFASISVPIHF